MTLFRFIIVSTEQLNTTVKHKCCIASRVSGNVLVWEYGSINLLSKDDIEDNIMRVDSKEIAAELLEMTFYKGSQLSEYQLPI